MHQNRLEVSQYFEALVSELDLHVELFIKDNIHNEPHVAEINKVREAWLKEIRECEEQNLSLLLENETQLIPNEERCKRFCFLVEVVMYTTENCPFCWRLVSTNRYLKPGEIKCFQELLKFIPRSSSDYEFFNFVDWIFAKPSLDTLFFNAYEETPDVISIYIGSV
jgi:hypothetical protein